MSHIAELMPDVKDLEALRQAAMDVDCEMVKQPTYRWYGTFVGDSPLPPGVDKAKLGQCDYAIRVKGAGLDTYEIGVVKVGDKYALLCDEWQGGYGLVAKVGAGAAKLKQAYGARVAERHLAARGISVIRQVLESGKIVLKAVAR